MDSERGGVFARDFVATINGQEEAIDLDTHYRGYSLGKPTHHNLQKPDNDQVEPNSHVHR